MPLINTKQPKKINQTLGLFSLVIAWVLMNVTNSIYLGIVDGLAVDSGVIMFWSGLFMMIAWAVFIVVPLSKLNHSRKMFEPYVFPFVTGLYGIVVYAILVGSIISISIDIFIALAFLAGVIFGLSYSICIRADKLLMFLHKRPYRKALFLLSPMTILFLFLWLLPTVAPSIAFRFMPDEIRAEIVSETIPKYKVGDGFEHLRNSLPRYFDNINTSGNTARTMEQFAFVLQVQCGKIIRLEWARNHKIDLTIDGKLHDKPCP
ncbi:MAG: hypothetical protein EOO90_17455 [Pedobacter sp.]|nr:MAG: hypothetical protein EOO90_17455 [Pedobacter sp.]